MRSPRWWLATAATLALSTAGIAVHVNAASAESNGGVKVMPLGDSITAGSVAGGYRNGLWDRFKAKGYKVDFVGSQSNGPSTLGDHDHEGHPGYLINQVDQGVVNWLKKYQPHTVLLMAGTNDACYHRDISSAPQRLATLIGHITSTLPNAEVFVAQITPLTSVTQDAEVKSINAAIPNVVKAAGSHVHVVDQYSAFTKSDLSSDGIHPNAAGYEKMAAAWYKALLSVPGSIGNPAA
jgi:lysophospholipase L1-like esterase